MRSRVTEAELPATIRMRPTGRKDRRSVAGMAPETKERMHLVARMIAVGLSTTEAAKVLGVTPAVISVWKGRYPPLWHELLVQALDDVSGDNGPFPEITEEEIQRRCDEVRCGWDETTRRLRSGVPECTAPIYRLDPNSGGFKPTEAAIGQSNGEQPHRTATCPNCHTLRQMSRWLQTVARQLHALGISIQAPLGS